MTKMLLQNTTIARNRARKLMSILAGIICEDCIMMAADSQLTENQSGTKFFVDKISVVRFRFGEILVAEAGLHSLTNRVVERMRQKARDATIDHLDTVLQIAEDSIRESKAPLDDEQAKFCEDNPTGILCGFYVGKTPHLRSIAVSGNGISNPETANFSVYGIGSYLAHYLLSEYLPDGCHSNFAYGPLIFALKKVKDLCAYCGGDTVIKRIIPVPQYSIPARYVAKSERVPKEFVAIAEEKLQQLHDKDKQSLNYAMTMILHGIGSKLWDEHLERVKAEENRNLPVDNPNETG